MNIQFFYWEDCPSHSKALERLEAVMRSMNIEAGISRIEVRSDEEAARHAFPGSPTIRIDGEDIDPDGAAEQRVGLSCRIYYESDGRVTPLPPEEKIRTALKTACAKEAKR